MGWIGSAVYLVAPNLPQNFHFFNLCPHIFWVYYFSLSQCEKLLSTVNSFVVRLDMTCLYYLLNHNLPEPRRALMLRCLSRLQVFLFLFRLNSPGFRRTTTTTTPLPPTTIPTNITTYADLI